MPAVHRLVPSHWPRPLRSCTGLDSDDGIRPPPEPATTDETWHPHDTKCRWSTNWLIAEQEWPCQAYCTETTS